MDKTAEINREYYNNRFAEEGESVKAFWSSDESQRQRFEVLSQIGELDGKRLLDVGCGFGDFYRFLLNKGVMLGEYIGVDISPGVVKVAKTRFPNVSILYADILSLQIGEDVVDYSVASGIFALMVVDWEDYLIGVCKKMFAVSRIGIGINLLSTFSPNSDDGKNSYYAEPDRILRLLQEKISYRAVLRHDYRLNDFTIFIYKGDER